jgi:DNA topoisomerase-2
VIEIRKKARETVVKVTELSVGTVTQVGKRSIYDFKTHLDLLESRDEILSYTDSSTDEVINFEVLFRTKDIEGWTKAGFMERLKLYSSIKTSNMHLFDSKGVIRKYETAEEILWEFFKYRKSFYVRRKKHLVAELSDEYEKITEKARFIKMVVDGELVVFKRSKVDIVEDITALGFKKIEPNGYNHLLDIRIHSFTLEKYNELQDLVKKISRELCTLKDKTTTQLWNDDLDCLREINLSEA